MINFPIILLHISIILLFLMSIYLINIRNKKQIHYAFLSLMVAVFIWSLGQLLSIYNGYANMVYIYIYFIGVCFTPVSILLVGLIFVYTKIKFSFRHLVLIIFPLLDYAILLTNKFHNLFFIKYSIYNNQAQYGNFYLVHAIISYVYIIIGIYYLVYFSIKNSGFFSKQSILIIIGTVVPLMVNIIQTLNIINIPVYYTAIAFSFAVICFAFAILKFQLLNIVPVALQNVVDQISDSYIILNENLETIDYNKTFIDTFSEIFSIKRKENIVKILKPDVKSNNINTDEVTECIREAIRERKTVAFEKQIISGVFDKFFAIEITPIIKNDNHIGTIILFKDISQHKKDLELIQQTQNQLAERERLAILGELAGGVAHDINSPLSAVQTGLFILNRIYGKCLSLTENQEVITEELRQEVRDMEKHIKNGNSACEKIAKIVNSVRNHTRNLSGENIQDFNVTDVIKDLKILINHQLRSAECEMVLVDEKKAMVKGDPGKLGQVLTNLIVNAMQAYNGKPGKIEVTVGMEENNVTIKVADEAGGIAEMFKDGIFTKILTTKGTKGTGLGLYLSHSLITGHFGGKLEYKSETGKGTTFIVTIPKNEKK